MKQKPLLISLLISLGTGVIAGFLTFKSMETEVFLRHILTIHAKI